MLPEWILPKSLITSRREMAPRVTQSQTQTSALFFHRHITP
jgi:hypothetical protein